VKFWQRDRNNKNAKIEWRFTNDNARIKLKKLYPTILDLRDNSVFDVHLLVALDGLGFYPQTVYCRTYKALQRSFIPAGRNVMMR
jgi:hypothetical protein